MNDQTPDQGSAAPRVDLRICAYNHHKEHGEIMSFCDKHPETQLTCGPFQHTCLKCHPEEMRRCGICGAMVVFCCC